MKKIKIAFIISNLGQGGAEKQLMELIKGIDKNKFIVNVYLYAYQKQAFYTEIFNLKDVIVFKNILKYKFSSIKILEALLYIRRILKKNDYDIVFTTLYMNSFFVRLVAPKKYKNKLIASSRTSIVPYNKFRIFSEKYLIRKSYLVCNSENTRSNFYDIINNKYHTKIKMIYNGFNIVNHNTSIIEENHNDKFIIGGLGRMSIEKNFLQLVRVFKEIFKQNPKNLELLIQGSSGNETENVRKLSESFNNIVIRKASPKVEKFFDKIDILVISSKFEGCPNVLFEGMIYKKICIISAGANSDNFVKNGVNGFVYDGTDEKLTETILKVLSILDTPKEKEIIQDAFKYVSDNFNMNLMVSNYEKLFSEILNNN